MRAALGRALIVAGTVLALEAGAHDDPPGCGSSGVALVVSLFRADGTTGLVGSASECERMLYRVRLQPVAASGCAFSGGTLTLTTADGVAHRISADVPPVGGASSTRATFESALIPYTVRARDVVNGKIRAIARYDGGIAHDSAADTKGLAASVDRNVEIDWCGDADPCTYDRCDPGKTGAAACSHTALCWDDDPLTADNCAGGQCTFEPIASGDRTFCAARPFRGHHALADRRGAGGRHAHD
jgi:hypothetical protein